MSEPDLEKVQKYFEAALEVPKDQRSEFLAKLSDIDTAVRNEVEALLLADEKTQVLDAIHLPDRGASKQLGIRPGDKIGPHEILGQIGKGGMGVIFKAIDTRLDRHVALKFLPASMHTDDAIRQRFMAEARTASQLDHPNICVIHDVGETPDGQIFITMPCYEGETLTQRIQRGPLSETDTTDIAIQICDGLAAAHAQNIVHRDIKPSNIMLTRDGYIKILDFGIAKIQDVSLTSTGMSIGTLSYMSPEQLCGETVDARTDVWALGAVIFEMLNAKKAFPQKALPAIIQSVLNDTNEPLVSMGTDISNAVREVIRMALERDQEKRFLNISAMRTALLTAQESLQHTASTEKTSNFKPNQNTKSRSYDWDDDVLDKVANLLTPILGPIAPKLVQRMSKTASNVNELSERLGEYLPDPADRSRFYRQMETQVAAATCPPAPRALNTDGSLMGIDLNASQLATLETALTPHLGPIAPTMIKRVASNASSFEHLCQSMSDHLDSESEKKKFMRQIAHLLKN